MANNENLLKGHQPTEFQSGREAVENGKKGGKKLGENNELRRSFAALGQAMVNEIVSEEHINKLKERFPTLTHEELTNKVLMLSKQMQKATVDGDSKAFEIIRDTIGEKPIDRTENKDVKEFDENIEYLD